jgi:hypothetical protein
VVLIAAHSMAPEPGNGCKSLSVYFNEVRVKTTVSDCGKPHDMYEPKEGANERSERVTN